MSTTDCVRVTTVVAADPASAFDLFTREVDAWWRRGPRFRHGPGRPSVMRFEGGEGGRLVELYTDAAGGAFEVGRVLAWKPGDQLIFQWRGNDFDDGAIYVGRFSGQTPWERHPDADELLYVLEGAVEITLLAEGGPAQVSVAAGSAFVVPRGLWHRQHALKGVTLLAAVPDNSEISEADDPRS